MSYGVALRNGVPFTLGTIAALCVNATTQWNPLSLWPDGIDTPGMWISPRTLTSEWQDSVGTTPVATPGTVADSSNPVGLALDLRSGNPVPLGPELVDNLAPAVGVAVLVGANTYELIGSPEYMFSWSDIGQEINKTYLVEGTISNLNSNGFAIYLNGNSVVVTSNGDYSFRLTTTSSGSGFNCYTTANNGTVISFFVREIPGNHMLQSTSAARPLLSARVNLLTYTEDFSHTWGWSNGDIATTNKLAAAANSSPHGVHSTFPAMDNPEFTVRASAAEYGFLHLVSGPGISPNDGVSYCATFDLVNGTVIKDGSWGTSAQIVAVGGGLYDCSVVSVFTGCFHAVICYGPTATTNVYLGDGTSGVNVFRAQISYQGTDYQSVPGDGSTYASGPPIAQKYDGVDDGMATAAFSAGTLIDGMDCLIAVRRDSAASCVAGLYNGVADATKFFGMAESASGSGCVGSGAGTPTVWVDNTQLTGGTAVTRGTLHTALTVGDWHILEFRNLDLSTWAAAGFGLYTSYLFPGPRGDILLFPSTASTEDKDAARQWLADYYGVTLP